MSYDAIRRLPTMTPIELQSARIGLGKDRWKELLLFSPKDPEADPDFATFLTQKTGWIPEFVEQLLRPYRRALHMWLVCDQPIVPSPTIDEIRRWHELYTLRYWDKACRDVYGPPPCDESSCAPATTPAEVTDNDQRAMADSGTLVDVTPIIFSSLQAQ
jgi:hypothetical protein